LNLISVHPIRDFRIIAFLPVAGVTDSLMMGFDYYWVLGTSRIPTYSSYHLP